MRKLLLMAFQIIICSLCTALHATNSCKKFFASRNTMSFSPEITSTTANVVFFVSLFFLDLFLSATQLKKQG